MCVLLKTGHLSSLISCLVRTLRHKAEITKFRHTKNWWPAQLESWIALRSRMQRMRLLRKEFGLHWPCSRRHISSVYQIMSMGVRSSRLKGLFLMSPFQSIALTWGIQSGVCTPLWRTRRIFPTRKPRRARDCLWLRTV